MPSPRITVKRNERAVVVRLHEDLCIPTAGAVYQRLQKVAKRRDIQKVVLDFSEVDRIDSAGIAVVSLMRRQLDRSGKELDLTELDEQQRAALDLAPVGDKPPAREPIPGWIERLGDRTLGLRTATRELLSMMADTVRQTVAVATGKKRLPAGSVGEQIITMGVDAIFIVGLLSFLLGMTMAFQGATQLQRFGAGVFVADMIGMSVVRELAPLITAIILTGRTGAAIAAELGTMRIRSEVDALTAMGINPNRFLIVPRMLAITVVGPALTVMAMFIGILGGMFVASMVVDMPLVAFWLRLTERLTLWDWGHGIGKSLVFSWIIGIAGSHLGMRAGKDSSAVGAATTRTVVVSIFFIIIVDAIFATIATLTRPA
jgi:phospholipid/cholesterol/gamma-HCH transport system permease protein